MYQKILKYVCFVKYLSKRQSGFRKGYMDTIRFKGKNMQYLWYRDKALPNTYGKSKSGMNITNLFQN